MDSHAPQGKAGSPQHIPGRNIYPEMLHSTSLGPRPKAASRRCSTATPPRSQRPVWSASPQLYAVEKKIRGKPPATRQAVRWTESAPLVNRFGVWLDEQRSRVSPRSRLGEKLTYIANQWEGLLVFLYDGRVEMDTNFVENRIRPVKLTAKNALFAGHDEGAAAWGRIASLLETCKMNGVEPYAWLKSTLEKIAGGHPQSRIRELLPWNFDPASS